MSSILIVEADAATATFLCDQLSADDYAPAAVSTVEAAREFAAEQHPQLLLAGAPAEPRGALALVAEVRAGRWPFDARLPVIVLSPSADELDVLRAFRHGADDVMAKPAGYPELRARIAALLRRCAPVAPDEIVRVGALEIDTRARRVRIEGARVELTPREYSLLLHLAADPERVFTKEELIRAVWGHDAFGAGRTLDSHACRLRDKLCRGGGHGWVINAWGIGYALRYGPLGEVA
jgi:DNA-binding response OmpR family regulator